VRSKGFRISVFVDKVVGDAFRKDMKYAAPDAVARPEDTCPGWCFSTGDHTTLVKHDQVAIQAYLNFGPDAGVATTVRAREQL
jgi:hypothetical protein